MSERKAKRASWKARRSAVVQQRRWPHPERIERDFWRLSRAARLAGIFGRGEPPFAKLPAVILDASAFTRPNGT